MKFLFHKEIKLYVKLCEVLNTLVCLSIFVVIFDDFIRKLKLYIGEQP